MRRAVTVIAWIVVLGAAACFLPDGEDIYPGDDDDSAGEEAA